MPERARLVPGQGKVMQRQVAGGGREEAPSAAVNPLDKDGDGRIDGTELLSLLLSASKK